MYSRRYYIVKKQTDMYLNSLSEVFPDFIMKLNIILFTIIYRTTIHNSLADVLRMCICVNNYGLIIVYDYYYIHFTYFFL